MPRLRRLVSPVAPTLRAPLAAGLIVFLVAVATTQVALRVAGDEADEHIERLSRVYLAGVADAVAPMLRSGDLAGFDARFAEAVADHEGVVERVLFAFQTDGRLVATAGDVAMSSDEARRIKVEGFRIDEGQQIAWVSRRLAAPQDFVLVAGLDVSEIFDARNGLRLAIVGIDLFIAAICAVLAYVALRRMNRPLSDVVDRLSAASAGELQPVPTAAFEGGDDRIGSLYRSFNSLIESVRERERLRDSLAEREQAAALGRLAATIAHEVRNPLGGLATAVSTLKRFGDAPDVRAESLGFLERGIDALDKIVTSTLNIYRPEDERVLTVVDFEDMERLVRPAAATGAITLDWRIDLPKSLSISASGARQVLLNLLLNACAVTPPGGRVGLAAYVENGELVCVITDQGGGMSPSHVNRLSGAAPDGQSKRLGIDVIVGLLEALDGRASVRSDIEGGTAVTIVFPLEEYDG